MPASDLHPGSAATDHPIRKDGVVWRSCAVGAGGLLIAAILGAGCDPIPLLVHNSGTEDMLSAPLPDAGAWPPSCTDGVRNGRESSTDCGGDCLPCADRRTCGGNEDCASTVCKSGVCVSCDDKVADGDESDVDCGGARCTGCLLDQQCRQDSDCVSSLRCQGGKCGLIRDGIDFNRSVNYAVSNSIDGLVIADVDGNGVLDIAILDLARDGVGVLAGRGDGTFGLPQGITALGGDLHGIAAGDLDGDGKDDLVVGSGSGLNVHVLSSRRGPQTLRARYAPRTLVIADFDGDGHNDIGVASLAGAEFGVYRGNGQGDLDSVVAIGLQGGPGEQIAVGDLDADGRTDVVLNGPFGPTQVLFGNSDPKKPLGLRFIYWFPDGLGNQFVYGAAGVGHFDDEGGNDIVTSHAGGALQLLLGDGQGHFKLPSLQALTKNRPESLAVADFNKDGFDDIALGCDIDRSVQVLIGDGKGAFTMLFERSAKSYVTSVKAADLNRDGKPDLVTLVGQDTLTVAIQK